MQWMLLILASMMIGGCAMSGERESQEPVRWAIALHGGAGTMDRDAPVDQVTAYRNSLRTALEEGTRRLEAGASAVDVAEAVVRMLEDDPLFNAGRGAALTVDGRAELDASIMDGSTLRCGAVAGVTTVKNPVSLARLVMERTRYVLLARDGAEAFASASGVERVDPAYFITPRRRQLLEEWKKGRAAATPQTTYGTVGCVVRDAHGRLAAATSTGGLTGKQWGRVGDSPVIGAGTYANALVAISCTGTGEEFIRHGVAKAVADRVELAGEKLDAATNHLVFRTLQKDDGGLIAVDRDGRIAMPFNSDGMYRAAADSAGRFEVRIWEE